ncbi:MAG TPA: hypothetical protein VFJ29_00030, partial [Candidatus Kapabacteria bacterium]|nr:hypothetical protein [Candidatus Kapabacteria bacterium]
MKYFAIAISILIFSAGLANADDGKPLTASGNRAILFSLTGGLSSMNTSGLFNIAAPASLNVSLGGDSSFRQSGLFGAVVPGVGMRMYLSNNMAIRGGLGF